MRTPQKYLKWSFLLLPTCIKQILAIKFHHPTCQTPEMRKISSNCNPQIFRFLHWNTWLDELTWLAAQYSIVFYISFCLFRACFTHWFLQIWVAIYFYGSMINWSTLIKKLMQTYIVIVSGSTLNVSTGHLYGIWHLIWRYLSKPDLGGHPLLCGHYSIPRRCPLNTGFTVLKPIYN